MRVEFNGTDQIGLLDDALLLLYAAPPVCCDLFVDYIIYSTVLHKPSWLRKKQCFHRFSWVSNRLSIMAHQNPERPLKILPQEGVFYL
jgi:hypothetical protein